MARKQGILHPIHTHREMEDDPFDSLLGLEDQYYKEGYDLGVKDGSQAGLIEGRLFGLEKGFEKYAAMGIMHGRSVFWAGRLPRPQAETPEASTVVKDKQSPQRAYNSQFKLPNQEGNTSSAACAIHQLPVNARLEKHVRILYALAEPSSLSTENSEESVSDFDDRLKRADGKVKIIEKLLDEFSTDSHVTTEPAGRNGQVVHNPKSDGGIEDVSSLRASN